MKKLLVLGSILFALSASAQEGKKVEKTELGSNVSELLNKSDYYGLSVEQLEKIKLRKESIGKEFREISTNQSLSGKDKAMKKKALSESFKKDINSILSDDQRTLWTTEEMNKKINKSAKKGIEYKLELLELEYESNLKNLERNHKADKNFESMKNELKAKYKTQKEDLKAQQDLL